MSEKELRKENEEKAKIKQEERTISEEEFEIDNYIKAEVKDTSLLRLLEQEFVKSIRNEIIQLSKSARFPNWINKPWARIKPHKNFVETWYNKWANVLLIYSKKSMRFRFSVTELANTFPFSDGERSLNIDDIKKLVDILIRKGIAKWLDSNKSDFLIYWIPKEQLIEKIYEHAKELGLPILRIKVIKEALNDMPQKELIEMMRELVNNNYGKWIVFKEALKLNYPI